jgi:hypothetical protein
MQLEQELKGNLKKPGKITLRLIKMVVVTCCLTPEMYNEIRALQLQDKYKFGWSKIFRLGYERLQNGEKDTDALLSKIAKLSQKLDFYVKFCLELESQLNSIKAQGKT